jgi:hypothetical protein
MRRIAGVMLAAGLVFGLSACGEDEVDRQGTIDNLVEGGMDEEQAECLVNGVTDELGDEKVLALEDDPDGSSLTAEEQEKLGEITLECFGMGDISIPDISVPDISVPDVSLPEE